MSSIRELRTKGLEGPISKKIDENTARNLFNSQGPEGLLDRLTKEHDFEMDANGKRWIVNKCNNHNELIYAFQLFFQRALNKGRGFSTQDDLKCITEGINFSILEAEDNELIGSVLTIGIIEDKPEKIQIRSCAVPVKKGKGTITCINKLSINYYPLRKLMKDYNIYIKIYPDIPENNGQWETALLIAIYSAITNKILPKSTLVLGGITKKGEVIPVDGEVIKRNKDTKCTIYISAENKISIDSNDSCHFIYVHHIDEIISLLEGIEEIGVKRKYKDFLCE